MKRTLLFIIIVILCTCCNNTSNEYHQWIDKQIYFPDSVSKVNYSFKIVCYTGLADCVVCEIAPNAWRKFIKDLEVFAKIPIFLFMHPNKELENNLKIQFSDLPLYFDDNDGFYKLNHFSTDKRFHCFLLDENNKVILIGNPVKNPKIRELYIRTICERLGVDYHKTTEVPKNLDLGTFSQSQTKTAEFVIPNNTQKVREIDSVYTSCECTTAEIDNKVIHPKENTKISVTYKPDGVGDFYREVYVKVKDVDKPLVYSIKGIVMQ